MNDIVLRFFNRDFESGINECLFFRKYVMDKDKVLQYVGDVVSVPISNYLDFIIKEGAPSFFPINSVIQYSSIYDSTSKICLKLENEGDEGYDMTKVGQMLLDDGQERKIGAYRKYGENQAKTAVEFGLVQENHGYYFLSCLGKIFNELGEDKTELLRRTILRNLFFQRLISVSQSKEVSIYEQLSTSFKDSTIKRRLSNIKTVFDIIRGSDGLADPYVKNIKELDLGGQMELPIAADVFTEGNMGFRQKKTILQVTTPDNTIICKRTATDTFIAVINYIGPPIVAQLGFTIADRPLLSKSELAHNNYSQRLLDGGWCLLIPSSTNAKRKQLEKISQALGLNLLIEDIPLGHEGDKHHEGTQQPDVRFDTWILPWSSQLYNLPQRITDYGFLYWKQGHYHFHKNDIVYIYESAPGSRIRYKFVVDETDILLTKDEFQADLPYQSVEGIFTIEQPRTKIRFIDEFDTDLLTRQYIVDNGINGNIQGPMKAPSQLVEYIENLPIVKEENAKRSDLIHYKTAFSILNCMKVKGHLAPHKPILLLSVLDLINEGEITENIIYPTDTLVQRFNELWSEFVPDDYGFTSNCWLPYYHLKSDGFWHWGSHKVNIDTVDAIRSQKQLRKNGIYAFFDDKLFQLIQDPNNRMILEQALKRFLPKQ